MEFWELSPLASGIAKGNVSMKVAATKLTRKVVLLYWKIYQLFKLGSTENYGFGILFVCFRKSASPYHSSTVSS